MILVGDIVPLQSEFVSPDFGDELVLGNLEGPICGDGLKPMDKVGPCLHSKPFNLKGRWAFVLANNHSMDFRAQGLEETLGFLKDGFVFCVGCCGAGANEDDARKILYLEEKGIRVAVISCCERQFGVSDKSHPGVAAYGDWVLNAIIEAKKQADRVIVSCHAGSELSTAVSPKLQALYHRWIDAGADVIHGHHAHIPQGYEVYREKPIFYGLGNFIVDKSQWRGRSNALWSLTVRIDFSRDALSWTLMPAGEYPEEWEVYVNNASKIFTDECLLLRSWEENCKALYPIYYRPYLKMGIKSIMRWILCPKKQYLLMRCFKECETHKDIIQTAEKLRRVCKC